MSDFPVDELNLSFSGDEYENLFITQSSFNNVTTQDVSDAVEYFNDLGEVSFGDSTNVESGDLSKLSPKTERMCGKVFDFSDDVDNSWSVSTQDFPIVVTRNSDGKQFLFGDDDSKVINVTVNDEEKSKIVESKELEQDLK